MKNMKIKQVILKVFACLGFGLLFSSSYAATDLLADALNNEVQTYFGTNAAFWKFFVIGDLAMSTYAGIKSKSPLVFTFVLLTAFIPGILLKAFVFH